VSVYAVDAIPALAVMMGLVELAPGQSAVMVSGTNFEANLGTAVTV
jgi:broad specificity polyphosphatase/5'/3'-nucleotidase SurE